MMYSEITCVKFARMQAWLGRASAWVKILILFAGLFPAEGFSASSEAYLDEILLRGKSQHIAASLPWRRILLIPDRIWQGDTSIVDEPSFFLAQDGRNNPHAELEATLRGFFEVQRDGENAERHPRCLHPARFAFLHKELNLDSARLPQVQCASFEDFSSRLRYDRVSLIFSNYFMQNPASLFGHMFLKLHRVRGVGEQDHPMLDDVIGFAAAVDDEYSPLYPLKGLAGGYWGRFSLFPYHRKIQEYNNYESRDLWEFGLTLTPDEVERLELMMWELGSTRLSYYYLHQNCSYVMLSLLEAAAPRLFLTKQFQVYAIPADTVRAVTSVPGLLGQVSYRPSAESRYILRLKDLSDAEVKILEEIMIQKDSPLTDVWGDCHSLCRARVIDAALEYFDYSEKLAGDRTTEKYGRLRQSLLLERAALGVKAPELGAEPVSTRVDFGHDSALIGLRGGYQDVRGSFIDWQVRPALQDLLASAVGYQEQMEVKFLDATFRHYTSEPRISLTRLDVLKVSSYAADLPLMRQYAWNFALGAEEGFGFGAAQNPMRAYFQLHFGKAFITRSKEFMAYVMTGIDVGHASIPKRPWHAGGRLIAGTVYRMTPDLRLVSTLEMGRYADPHPLDRLDYQASLVGSLSRNRDINLTFARRSEPSEISIGFRQYF